MGTLTSSKLGIEGEILPPEKAAKPTKKPLAITNFHVTLAPFVHLFSHMQEKETILCSLTTYRD